MNDKIEMTVTINPLVSPLLFERLSSCPTARHRAALLRALAEASLRQELTGSSRPAAGAGPVAVAPVANAPFVVAPAAASQPQADFDHAVAASRANPSLPPRDATGQPTTRAAGGEDGFQTLRVSEANDVSPAFGDDLSSQLAGFLD